MGFTELINEDIKKAMLAREKEKLAALRDIKSKLLLEATSGNGEVSDEVGIKICMKLHKQRMETYELYIAQNRQDLADDELFQAKIFEAYLPKMMDEEEVKVTRLTGLEQQLLLSVIPTLHQSENGLKLDVRERNLLLYVSA
jgi:uncharacterized protein YqeY